MAFLQTFLNTCYEYLIRNNKQDLWVYLFAIIWTEDLGSREVVFMRRGSSALLD